MNRIVVIGDSGSGKSSTGEELARRLGFPFVELDELFWSSNWCPKPTEDFRALVEERTRGDHWVVAGNYSGVRDILWPRATAIVWLNLPMAVVLVRLVRRTFARLARREVLWHGNRESAWRTLCTRDSVIWWMVTTHHRRQREFSELRRSNAYPGLAWSELTRSADVDAFLATAVASAPRSPAASTPPASRSSLSRTSDR